MIMAFVRDPVRSVLMVMWALLGFAGLLVPTDKGAAVIGIAVAGALATHYGRLATYIVAGYISRNGKEER